MADGSITSVGGTGDTWQSRWAPAQLAQRLEREARKRANEVPLPFPRNLRQSSTPYRWLNTLLKFTGLRILGERSYLEPRLTENLVHLDRLPPAFDGLRILQLTDLHFDLCLALADKVRALVAGLDYDVCLITGDFRDSLLERGRAGIDASAALIGELRQPVLGCLGNHDLAADLPLLEAAGIRILVNEHTWIQRGTQRLYFAGVDESSYMETDDPVAAMDGIPAGACTVMMSHAPGNYAAVAAAGPDLMLAGHTHGGQICLPGGWAPLTHCKCPRQMVRGAWRHGRMQGYTSSGTGACRVPARFFCPGEIVTHTLRTSQ